MATIDHSLTKVLLIGASRFPSDPDITAIPNVEVNIKQLNHCLTDADLIGVPEENITVSINESKSQIEKKLRDIANETRNKSFTLLVYYSGHGILSGEDYRLYLTTYDTTKKDLEIDGLNIDQFKNYIKKSFAGRKIVILDCCHSGAIIGSMNTITSTIQAEIKGFEGTYVMTSSAETTSSLFPVLDVTLPTFFTGKLLEVIKEGTDPELEYNTLRNIFKQIDQDFLLRKLPRPQQSIINTADELYFSRNKQFKPNKTDDEIAWEACVLKNTKWAYLDFKTKYPNNVNSIVAKKMIYDLEEETCWINALRKKTLSAVDEYLDNYPDGKYIIEAKESLNNMSDKDHQIQGLAADAEEKNWEYALSKNDVEPYLRYLRLFPSGKYGKECHEKIKNLQKLPQDEYNVYNKKKRKSKFEWVKKSKWIPFAILYFVVIVFFTFAIIKSETKSVVESNTPTQSNDLPKVIPEYVDSVSSSNTNEFKR